MAQLADAVEQTIEVNALPEDCFRVAADFERYPLWAGSVQYVKVLEQVAGSDLWAGSVQNVKVLEQVDRGDLGRRAEFSVGAFGTSLSYTLEYDYDPPRRMRWTAVAGGVKELLGVYEFSPLADGRTQVRYQLSIDPGFFLPSMVRQASTKLIVGTALGELKRRVEKLKAAEAATAGYRS